MTPCTWPGCGKTHPAKWWHGNGQCTVIVDGLYCTGRALRYNGQPSLFCRAHGVEL